MLRCYPTDTHPVSCGVYCLGSYKSDTIPLPDVHARIQGCHSKLTAPAKASLCYRRAILLVLWLEILLNLPPPTLRIISFLWGPMHENSLVSSVFPHSFIVISRQLSLNLIFLNTWLNVILGHPMRESVNQLWRFRYCGTLRRQGVWNSRFWRWKQQALPKRRSHHQTRRIISKYFQLHQNRCHILRESRLYNSVSSNCRKHWNLGFCESWGNF